MGHRRLSSGAGPFVAESIASCLPFYDDSDFHALARNAGFTTIRIVRRNLQPIAKQVGIPEEHLPLFGMLDARFLLVRRD